MALAKDVLLRPPTEEDYPAMGELHAECYPAVGLSPAERARRIPDHPQVRPDQRVVALAGGELVGMFSLLRFELWLGGRPVPAGGLAGVAVAPHARGAGIGSRLVEHALSVCGAERRPVLILYPFREDFYHRLGFVTVYEQRRCRFPAAWLPLFDERRRVRRATLADVPALMRAHDQFCRRTSGSISRGARAFEKLVADNHAVVVPADGGEAEAYLLWRYDAPYDEAQALEVVELVHTTASSYRALLGHLATQRDQVREVRYDIAPDDPFPALLVRNSSTPAPHLRALHQDVASVAAGAMMRLVDLPAALLARGGFGDGELALRVAGQAPLRLLVKGGEVALEPDDGSGPGVATDARTFARLYAGATRPSEAVRLGLADVGGDLAAADRIFSLPRPYLLDVF